jgi:LysR family hydrogen peroxide-inducible transcriptional activator
VLAYSIGPTDNFYKNNRFFRYMAINPYSRAATQISLKQLHYLVTLRDTLNFTRAAERCFVTQSTLSGGLKELESSLDCQLVERDRQNVLFTPLGDEVVTLARRLLSDTGDLIQRCEDAKAPGRGQWRLGAIPTIAPFLLPPLLRELRQSLPHLQVLLREEPTDALLQALEAGDLDMAIIALPMDTRRLRVEPLFSEELWLICSPEDAMVKVDQPRLAKLQAERLLLMSDGHCLTDHTLQACSPTQRHKANSPSQIEATSLATLVQMVEAGLGIALLPEMAIKSQWLTQGRVLAKPLAAPAPQRQIALVMRATHTRREVEDEMVRVARLVGRPTVTGARRSRIKKAP